MGQPSGQADGGSYSRYWAQHLSQHLVNTCFPVSTLAVLTPIFVSQQLPLKADLCTNVHPQALGTVWKNGVSRPVGFDWPVGVAVAHQQASFDAAGAPDAPM